MEKGMQGTAMQAKHFYNKLGTGFRQRELNLYMCDILIQNNFVTLHSAITYLSLTTVLHKNKLMLIYNS